MAPVSHPGRRMARAWYLSLHAWVVVKFLKRFITESSLYMINADGTGLKQLTPRPGSDFDPAWSPDGKQIAFTSVRGGFRQIYALDVDSLGCYTAYKYN